MANASGNGQDLGVTHLGVVIPTLNAGTRLGDAIGALTAASAVGLDLDLVVADGGSTDATPALAARLGARLIFPPRGRGAQLAAGAMAARGDWLLFLHADTVLTPGWAGAAVRYMAAPANRERAATFRFALDDPSPAARRVERLVGWRGRALGLPYGDQGLLIARSFYESLGGFQPLPLMEDVDLIRRIGRRRLVLLETPAVTSAARYRRGGWTRRPLLNLLCLALFFAGLPPRLIARLYG